MKTQIKILLAASSLLVGVGCSQQAPPQSAPVSQETVVATQEIPTEQPTASTEQGSLTLATFITALESKGLPIQSKNEKFFGMLMATGGVGLTIAKKDIEVYQFDTTITSGKDALARLEKDGLVGQRVLVNKNLALVSNLQHPKWEQIKAVFSGL